MIIRVPPEGGVCRGNESAEVDWKRSKKGKPLRGVIPDFAYRTRHALAL